MKRSKKSGMTLLEALVASSITVTVLGTATAVWLAGARSWTRGTGRIDAEVTSRKAVRSISDEIMAAMDVTVDADGQGVTFHVPSKDNNGDYVMDVMGQPVSDGINRRIYLSGTNIVYNDGVGIRTMAKNVITTDPLSTNGTQPYKIFVPGQGAIIRQVTVMVATKTGGVGKEKVYGRKRETVFLRNIYNTTR